MIKLFKTVTGSAQAMEFSTLASAKKYALNNNKRVLMGDTGVYLVPCTTRCASRLVKAGYEAI